MSTLPEGTRGKRVLFIFGGDRSLASNVVFLFGGGPLVGDSLCGATISFELVVATSDH